MFRIDVYWKVQELFSETGLFETIHNEKSQVQASQMHSQRLFPL